MPDKAVNRPNDLRLNAWSPDFGNSAQAEI